MDFSELTKIIFNRIQNAEPDNVVKIMGCILLREPGEQEMIQMAFGPEPTLLSMIADAKAMLHMISAKATAAMASSQMQQYWDQQLSSLDDQLDSSNPMGNYYYQENSGGLSSRSSRRSPSLPEFPIKACHYFYKGYCKHGSNCRYFHGPSYPDSYSSYEYGNEEGWFSAGSLEKLEMEITELLRSRRGMPVSIASLPMLYYEKYGRHLQAEGYLTESQRHGKAGFSLTKLLARLKNSIRLIDRPHGQHSVVLAEDAPRYMEYRNDRSESGAIAASSHQIYLTFPAESIFTEEDVSSYFNQYGPVRDVRIPSQEKRMFGFVSFVYAETVNMILMKRNPHYICGARVLVKPYREKSKSFDRNYNHMEKLKPPMYYSSSQYLEMDPELHSMQGEFGSSIFLKKHLIEEQEKMLELQRRHLSELNLVQEPPGQQSFFKFEEFELPEGLNEFSLDPFSYTTDALNNGSISDDKARNTSNSYSDHESQIDLPESPFASPRAGSSISAVM